MESRPRSRIQGEETRARSEGSGQVCRVPGVKNQRRITCKKMQEDLRNLVRLAKDKKISKRYTFLSCVEGNELHSNALV